MPRPLDCFVGQRLAGLLVGARTRRRGGEFELKAAHGPLRRLEHFRRLRDHVRSDPIAGQNCDCFFHRLKILISGRLKNYKRIKLANDYFAVRMRLLLGR